MQYAGGSNEPSNKRGATHRRRSSRAATFAVVIAIAAAALAGCGGGDEAPSGASGSAAAQSGAAVLAAPTAPAATAASQWSFVATEWQSFDLSAPATVRYGAGDAWIERNLGAGTASCTNAFFGGDPAVGIVKRCEALEPPAASWVFTADENQSFTLATPARVRYGVDGAWIEIDLPAGTFTCSNAFFGADPAFGVVKRCEVRHDAPNPPAWTLLANEYASFSLGAAGVVRYGFEPTWVELALAAGEHLCGNALFGDPLVGIVKRCELRTDGGGSTPSISGFTPTSGDVGTTVTVSGTGLDGITAAAVGGVDARFEIVSATEVRVTVPSDAVSGRITLIAGSAAAISASDFVVTPSPSIPTVSSVTSRYVVAGGRLTAFGSALDQVASAWLGAAALTIASQSPTSLVLIVPADAQSNLLVLVDRAGTARVAYPDVIQVQAPMTVSGFKPTVVTRGQTLTVMGHELGRATIVRFVGAEAPVAARSDDGASIFVTVPFAAMSGRITVVAGPDDEATSTSDVVIVDPVSVVAQVHHVGVGGTVTVTGTGLDRVRAVLLGATEVAIAARSNVAISFVVPNGTTCPNFTLRLDDSSTIAAGAVVTDADCVVRAASLEFAQVLSQRTDDPRLKLTADKETWLRAYVVGTAANTPAPLIRATASDGSGNTLGVLTLSGPATLPLLAAGADVPDDLRYDDSMAFRAELPSAWVQPGLRVRIEAGESQDTATVIEATPAFVDVGSLTVIVVPVWSGPYVGNVPTLDMVRRFVSGRLPIAEARIDIRLRAPYVLTSVTDGVSSPDQWSGALNELHALHALELPSALYYGFVYPLPSANSGIAYLNQPGANAPNLTALGWDASYPFWTDTMVHEMGHNLSRLHAPCGGPLDPDPLFPYPGGGFGPTPAFDLWLDRIWARPDNMRDVMGYCGGSWFSDYNLAGVQNFLEARPLGRNGVTVTGAVSTARWLAVRGTVRADAVRVGAVRVFTSPASRAIERDLGGRYTLRLTTRNGRIVERRFDPTAVDHVDGESHFSLELPDPGPLQRLDVLRNGALVFTRDADIVRAEKARTKAASATPQAAVRAAGSDWIVTWDAAGHPFASLTFVAGNSRRVLAVDAQGGSWTLPAAALRDLPSGGHLELGLSDGIETLLVKLARP